jgi:hypothetical protein
MAFLEIRLLIRLLVDCFAGVAEAVFIPLSKEYFFLGDNGSPNQRRTSIISWQLIFMFVAPF